MFMYSSEDIIISFQDDFENNNQHMQFAGLYGVQSFSRNFDLFAFGRMWLYSTEENLESS